MLGETNNQFYMAIGDNCIVFVNFTASIGDLMVANQEITVLYLKISQHQLEIWWSQNEFTGDALAEPVNGYL